MMKKLLALTLVLGLAGIAGAVPSLSSDVAQINYVAGDIATLTISSGDALPYGGWLGIDAGPGAWSGDMVVLMPQAGSDSMAEGVSFPGWWSFEANSLSTNPDDWVQAGDHFTIGLAGTAEGIITVTLYAFDGTTPVNSVDVESVVPEPMTLGLLGLGGLFLRRRK